ncbi:MAG: hypothetical protein HRU70_05815 [Phycisphaeraceae bacterium]|nr:MAG: hypothetical protein HRU70_05815 [Phycisphaeraceae bacterium]
MIPRADTTRPDRARHSVLILSVACSVAVHAALTYTLSRWPGALPHGPITDTPGEAPVLTLAFDRPAPEPSPTPPPEPPPTLPPVQPDPPPPEPSPVPTVPPPTPPQPTPTAAPAFEPSPIVAPASTADSPADPSPAPAEPTPAPRAPTPSRTAPVSSSPGTPNAGAPTADEPSHADARFTADFAGVKAERARRVVYAVDVSAVMIPTLPDVFAALSQSVARLDPDQEFQVVLFRDPIQVEGSPADSADLASWLAEGAIRPGDRPSLLRATPTNKALLKPALDAVNPGGPSNPISGLRRALALRPQVVFLFSSGIRRSGTTWGVGPEETLQELERLNAPDPRTARRPVVIKTIEFRVSDTADPSALMRKIAEAHGDGPAAYTPVTRDDLRRAARRGP